jgi:hypothetical protein
MYGPRVAVAKTWVKIAKEWVDIAKSWAEIAMPKNSGAKGTACVGNCG